MRDFVSANDRSGVKTAVPLAPVPECDFRCASVTGNNQRSQGIPGGATTRLMRCSKLQPSAVLFFFKLRGRLAAKSCRLQWLSTLRRRASAPRRTVRTTSCACWEAGAEPA